MEPLEDIDTQRESQVAEALGRIESLRPNAWDDVGSDARLGALREAEDALAVAYGRQVAAVDTYPAAPDDYGYYDAEDNSIGIGSYSLEHDDAREVVDTLLHEGRHAYQQWAVDHPWTHGDPAEVEAWRENIAHYTTYEDDPVRYMEQPIEADARRFSQAMLRHLYGGTG